MQRNNRKFDPLTDFTANDPDNFDDILPFPFSMIVEVLNETIMHKLSLEMHHIEQKKKNANYEGSVRQYHAQNTIDVEKISCLSHPSKTHNHLLAGDKAGYVYLLDLAKKTVFSKKQVAMGKRVIHIVDSIISDGDSSLTTAAVIQQNHHIISIIRYKQSEPKLFLTEQIQVAPDSSDPNTLPYSCQFFDFCRLLVVKTYNGNIIGFRLPEVTLNIEKHTKSDPIPLEEDQVKKILRYPINMVEFSSNITKIEEKNFVIEFKGEKIAPKYNDVKARLMNRKKNVAPVEEVGKKDPKKKQEKKEAAQEEKKPQTIEYNAKLIPIEADLINGVDQSPNYALPKYEPFIYIINDNISLQKSKYFQKNKTISFLNRVLYGWSNTKTFFIANLNQPDLVQLPEYLYLTYHQQRLPEERKQKLNEYLSRKMQLLNTRVFENVHTVTASCLSQPDQSLIAFGLRDGTISVWNPLSENLEFNSEKHSGEVTCLRFFEKWKMVSGDSQGEVFIHDVIKRTNQVKRTNTFQPKQPIPITGIEVSQLGIAFAVDIQGNMRVYDLWRNEKIAKFLASSSFSMLEGKGKRWLSHPFIRSNKTIYTNRDLTIIVSTNWPNLPVRVEDRSPEQVANLQQITANPWKANGTNIHVVRNFQFILSLFEGLESVYKKGYERRKIENLFSNLQFAQLYDRTFQIPDFGRPNGGDLKKSNSNTKSLFSSSVKKGSQKSLISSKSKQKSNKDSNKTKQVKLTNEVLHPEKFLLERRKINRDMMITSESLIDWIRQEHGKKEVREGKLLTDQSKSLF